MSKPEYMVWIDLETTGLDPREEGAGILELYGVITDTTPEYNFVGEPIHLIRRHEIEKLRFNPYTLQMHAKSGLFEDMTKPVHTLVDPVDNVYEAAQYPWKWMSPLPGIDLYYWLKDTVEFKHKPYLAGSSIHFDRKWLEVFEKGGFLDRIGYRNYDVSTLWLQHEVVTGEAPLGVNETTLHRAKDDILRSIEIARACAKVACGQGSNPRRARRQAQTLRF